MWGIIAVVMVAEGQGAPDLTHGFSPLQLLLSPIILNELFLAGWLIAKGFSSAPAHQA